MSNVQDELVREHILAWWADWSATGQDIPSTPVACKLIAARYGHTAAEVAKVHKSIKTSGPWSDKTLPRMSVKDQQALAASVEPPARPSEDTEEAPPKEDAVAPEVAPVPDQPKKANVKKSKSGATTPMSMLQESAQGFAQAAQSAVAAAPKPAAVPRPASKPVPVAAPPAKPAPAKPAPPTKGIGGKAPAEQPPLPDLSPTPCPEGATEQELKDWNMIEASKERLRNNASIVWLTLPHKCPKCDVNATNMDELIQRFGTRAVNNGTKIITQSNCRHHRQVSSTAAAANAKAQAIPRRAQQARESAQAAEQALLLKALGPSKSRKQSAATPAASKAKPKAAPKDKVDPALRAQQKAVADVVAGRASAASLRLVAGANKKRKPALDPALKAAMDAARPKAKPKAPAPKAKPEASDKD